MVIKANEIWADGPSGAPFNPHKPDVRIWGTWIESIIGAFFSTGGKIYQTRALLNADLTPAANSIAWVMEDPTVANNGIYRKVGGTGAGSWVRAGDLPFSFIVASNPGAGTPNDIQATTSMPVSSSALVILPIAATNTASPVTVSFNGGPALIIKTNSGNDVAAGGLVAGMIALGYVSGTTFRLASDQASASIVAAAEAAANAALAAANAGFVFNTVGSFVGTNIPSSLLFVRTSGYFTPGDGGGSTYVRLSSAPSPVQPWHRQSNDGAWWLLSPDGDVSFEMFGALGDGNTDDTVAIQTALNFAGVTKKKVIARGRVYVVSSIILIRQKVTLDGGGAATIKHKSGANLFDIINFEDGGQLLNFIIDGNRQSNQVNNAHVAVRIGNANDCVVERCVIKSATGNGVGINSGLRAVVRSNIIYDHFNIGITAFGNNAAHDHEISANEISQFGWAGIFLSHADGCRVFNNNITGIFIGGRDSRLKVNTSGAIVSWVSGPQFSTLRAGNFVTINNGEEYRITSVDSVTQLTVDRNMPTLSNAEASAGTGDLFGVTSSNFCVITGNVISRTTTYLFGFSLDSTGIQCGNNIFSNNTLNYAGKNAINLNGVDGTGYLENNSVSGNKIFNAGYGGGIGAYDRIAIFLSAGSPGKVNNTQIHSNSIVSFAGSGQTSYWLGTDGQLSFGSVSISGNKAIDVLNAGIFNDVVNLALSPSWGSSASVSGLVSYGNDITFTINCAGSGFAAQPDLTVQKIVDSCNTPPMPYSKIVSSSAGIAKLFTMFGERQSILGQWKSTMAGTPVSGDSFTITMKA